MYSKILVGTDGSETAGEAVRQAGRLAQTLGSELFVVHAAATNVAAADLGFGLPALGVEAIHNAGRQILEHAMSQAGSDVKVRTLMLDGDAADTILDTAEREGADLIVVGNRGMRGAKRFVLGSVPNRVAHHAPCSVLIVHTT